MTTVTLLISATGILTALFAGIYLVCRRLDNYGFVDVAWSYSFALVAVFYALNAPGWGGRRLALAAMAIFWSLRLGTHLLKRVASHHPVEDGRYVQLRKDWAGNFHPKMFGFFMLQAVSVILLSLPFLLPALNPQTTFSPIEILGGLLWLFAISGESIADAQLSAFKKDPAHRGQVCDTGLWRYSRHPNYFFEWLIWVAYLVFSLASPHGWLAAISPIAILFLLLRVTGIPLTEQQSLRSKGDAYRRYQQTTSVFIPWRPKSRS